ncbi:hypothetical protein DMUE_5190 [Dictyocoela muelleri]|nr:hypothetical protein DMUE_5190 [Dictyocoela muelleri]
MQLEQQAQLDVLKHIVSIDIQFRTGPSTIPDIYLNILLKQKYNHETSYKYYERLSSIKQCNFYTIRKYMREIEINCRKLAICLDWEPNLELQKQQEVFFNGLDSKRNLNFQNISRRISKVFMNQY